MKLLRLVSLATVVLVFTGTASAIKWVDRDPNSGNGPLAFLYEGGYETYARTFNITYDGYDPSMHWIDKIIVKFAFADGGNDYYEYVDISVGGVKLWDDQEFDGNHNNAPQSYDWYGMELDPTTHQSIYDDLMADGIVDYEVVIQDLHGNSGDSYYREDGYLKITKLKAYGHKKQVPDSGSTLAIMGLGLIGLFLARRKLR